MLKYLVKMKTVVVWLVMLVFTILGMQAQSYYYDEYDYIISMDKSNINRLNLIKEDTKGKYRLLFSFKRQDKEVADPWYTRDFERTYLDLVEGIEGLITYLKRYKKIKVEE